MQVEISIIITDVALICPSCGGHTFRKVHGSVYCINKTTTFPNIAPAICGYHISTTHNTKKRGPKKATRCSVPGCRKLPYPGTGKCQKHLFLYIKARKRLKRS